MLLSASGARGSFPVTAVIQNQINHTAAQGKHSVAVMLSCRHAKATKTHAGFAEKPAQVNAAGCDKPTEQQPEGGLGQALRGLGLPAQREQTKTLCNVCLKPKEHLQLHSKEIVLQASQAEGAVTKE
ncbi:hypothetical protein WJX82_003629 [Trebouxia sp. C0006]